MSKLSIEQPRICADDEPKENPYELEDMFKFENVIKVVGQINKNLYGRNPYEQN